MRHRLICGLLTSVLLVGMTLVSAPAAAAQGGFDLVVTMTGPTRVMSTRDYSFTVTVTNLGPETASNTIVGAQMGDWFNAVSFVCNDTGDTGIGGCVMASLAADHSMTATMTVNVCCLVRQEVRHAWVGASVGPLNGDFAAWHELDIDNDSVLYDVFIIGKRVK